MTSPPPLSTDAGVPSTSSSAPLTVVPKPDGLSRKNSEAGLNPGSDSAGGEKNSSGGSTTTAAALRGLMPLEGAGQAVSSPAELMTFVDTMLAQLEDKFNESSTEVLERMTTMSTRIDSLEMAISEIINGEIMPQLGGGGAAKATP